MVGKIEDFWNEASGLNTVAATSHVLSLISKINSDFDSESCAGHFSLGPL